MLVAGSPGLFTFSVLGVMAILNYCEPLLLTGMKTTVSEAEHPLLCEGTRREKGDLALALMITYKDDQAKLKKVRDWGTGILTGKANKFLHVSQGFPVKWEKGYSAHEGYGNTS